MARSKLLLRSRAISLSILLLLSTRSTNHAFLGEKGRVLVAFQRRPLLGTTTSSSSSSSSSAGSSGGGQGGGRGGGDRVRAATGIRPSLHPVTINALATYLTEQLRVVAADRDTVRVAADPSHPPLDSHSSTASNNDSFSSAPLTPLQVALHAGRVAAEALHQRRITSKTDGTAFTEQEESTVAGRIVGVAVRLDRLEERLRELCTQTPWIAKYNEWDAFGILPHETSNDSSSANNIAHRLRTDPLWTVCRAECLLALYLHEVEGPELLQKNLTVPGGTTVNFLDSDRLDVLLGRN